MSGHKGMGERAAARRRASFGRARRLAREAEQKAERETADARRKAERDRADRQRKADSAKAAEQRNAQARKQAEQRRLQRHKENARKDFSRKAEDGQAKAARAGQRRADAAAQEAERTRRAEHDQKRRDAEAHVARQHQRQAYEQRTEHRRQTHRMRVEQQAERSGFRHQEAGALIHHAGKIRTIDLAERRELDALDERRRSLAGRMVGLARGGKHYAARAQAIVDRHEDARWQQHRAHEARKEALFHAEQAARLRQVADRHGMALRHRAERTELVQAQDRSRPRLVEARLHAMAHANENQKPREKEQPKDNARPAQAFNQAAGHGVERAR